MLGKSLAENLKKKPGDTVEIEGEEFKAAGIFDSFNVYENGSAVVPIRDLQELMDQPGQVNEFQIVLDESAANQPNVNEEVARRIESLKDEAGKNWAGGAADAAVHQRQHRAAVFAGDGLGRLRPSHW